MHAVIDRRRDVMGHRLAWVARGLAAVACTLLGACGALPPGPATGPAPAQDATQGPSQLKQPAQASAGLGAQPAVSPSASAPTAATPSATTSSATAPPALPMPSSTHGPAAGAGTPGIAGNGLTPGAARSPTDPQDRPSDGATIEGAARAFYGYFDRVRQMTPGELAREFARLDPPGHPASVLEFALALGQTRNPGDTVRALNVLDPLARSTDPQMAPWRPLARLLTARYAEQRRLEEQIERQAQQLREAQRRQDQLAQQLEALKAIERSLTNRPPASPPPAGTGNRTPP